MAVPLSPHEIRMHQRQAQRAVRLALNSVHRNMDEWKVVIGRGKAAAVSLCNSLLQMRHVQSMDLGPIAAAFPDVREAAREQLRCQAVEQLEALYREVGQLAALADNFSGATAEVAELVEWQQQHPKLLLAAPFKEMSLTELYGILQRACSQHVQEAQVKGQVYTAFAAFAEQASAEPGERAQQLETPQLESRGQALTAAWMLPLEVDARSTDLQLASIKEEMAGL